MRRLCALGAQEGRRGLRRLNAAGRPGDSARAVRLTLGWPMALTFKGKFLLAKQ